MRALERVVRQIRSQNRQIAEVLCRAVDSFRYDPTPEKMQILLDVLRDGQMSCEEELRRLRGVNNRRRHHYSSIRGRHPECGRAIGQQYRLVAERTRLVEVRYRMLRQIGDAAAWILLNGNPRLVAPLYAPQTHQIPRKEGLAGVLLVEHALHQSGKFLVLETDLVRCVGTGDLLVVPVNGIGLEPLVLELKSSGEVKIGEELGVGIGSAYSNHPAHEQLSEEVTAVLEAEESPRGIQGLRADRQMREIEGRTRRMFELSRRGAQVLRRPASPHWKNMAMVIGRALVTGYSFDLAEGDVYKWAVRNHPGDDPEAALIHIHQRISEIAGISAQNPYAWASTADLASKDHLAVLVRPVALWELPPDYRATILCEEVLVGNTRRVGLLEAHLRNLGVVLTRVDGGVILTKDGDERAMTQLEFAHIDASVSLTGLSARDVAAAIAEGFSSREK